MVTTGKGQGGIFVSSDDGTNWTAINAGLTNSNVTSFAVNGANLYVGTYSKGVFVSTDNGLSWKTINLGRTRIQVYCMVVYNANQLSLYDLQGRKIKTFASGLQQGLVQQGIDVSDLQLHPGVYFIHLIINDKLYLKRVSIIE